MNADEAKAYMDLATQSTKDQRAANEAMINGALDATDRILLRDAAYTVLDIAKTADPT